MMSQRLAIFSMTARPRTVLSAFVILSSLALMDPPVADATPFTLGAFDTYGLLVNDGASGGDINTAPVNANIGIGNVTASVNLHNEVVNGKVDCAGNCSAAVSGGAITGTQPVSRGGASPSGSPASVNSNVAAVQSAINAALNLSSTYGAESGSGKAVSIDTGSQTINATSGFLDPSGAYVFTSSTFAIGNGNTLTINGSASDYVVIDISGNGTDKLDGALTLTGGITPDQVLINFIASGGNVQGAANGATLDGTFLIPDMGVQLNSLIIDGHVFGGETGANFQFVSNTFIEQPSFSVGSSTSPVPEPASLVLLGTGLMAACRWRKRRTVA